MRSYIRDNNGEELEDRWRNEQKHEGENLIWPRWARNEATCFLEDRERERDGEAHVSARPVEKGLR